MEALRLFEDQHVLSDLRLAGILTQLYQFLGQDAHDCRLQKCTADRLCKITAEPLLPVEQLVVTACIGSQRDHGHLLA